MVYFKMLIYLIIISIVYSIQILDHVSGCVLVNFENELYYLQKRDKLVAKRK